MEVLEEEDKPTILETTEELLEQVAEGVEAEPQLKLGEEVLATQQLVEALPDLAPEAMEIPAAVLQLVREGVEAEVRVVVDGRTPALETVEQVVMEEFPEVVVVVVGVPKVKIATMG